jgi:glycosyltransferase involved in cell wall biosynthesis
LVLEGVTGYVVPPRAADQVADAIIRLLREPEIAAEMGRVGSRRAAELFSIDRCVQQHFDLYRTAIN